VFWLGKEKWLLPPMFAHSARTLWPWNWGRGEEERRGPANSAPWGDSAGHLTSSPPPPPFEAALLGGGATFWFCRPQYSWPPTFRAQVPWQLGQEEEWRRGRREGRMWRQVPPGQGWGRRRRLCLWSRKSRVFCLLKCQDEGGRLLLRIT
jgi:hypothetical protein